MRTKLLFLSLFALLISTGCAVAVPDVKLCAVAGTISAGADCAYAVSGKTEELTLEEFIEFLEPNESRGAALCQSAEDWSKLKTALEQACKKLGTVCTYEMRSQLRIASKRIDALQRRVAARRL